MNEVIIYILKVIAIHGLLYLFYRVMLRNTGRHLFNRGYLLTAMIAAFFIPLIELSLPEKHSILEEGSVIFWLEPTSGWEEFELIPIQKESVGQSYWYLVPWLYAIIALALTVRSAFYLSMLRRLKKQSDYIKKRWFKLYKISQDRPFSFFSNVFMPKSLFGTDAFDQILTHECEHVRQFHSVDRLLTDFVVSLFWFNPFMYLYRNALIEIHEFQADEVVIRRFNDPVAYQEILFSQLQSEQYSGLVSHFNFSMIKKRIVMMNKQRKMSGWVYALTAPVMLMIVFAFSSKEAVAPLEQVGNEIAEFLGPDPNMELLPSWNLPNPKGETQNAKEVQRNVPSILPLKNTDNVRMTSGFGKRMHPIKKVEQWHQGMDFSCPVGTEVIATADGEVAEISDKLDGYGKMVTVDHGGGFITRYAQLSEFRVKEGDMVKKGDVIALSGNSGQSTAPHLHYEVKKGDKYVNPISYIKDFNFKVKLKEIPSSNEEEPNYEALRRQEQELVTQKEMFLAKEQAERAQIEQIKAQEIQESASEQERRAYQLQKEAEEKRLMEEKIRAEKLRFEDSKQERSFSIRGTGNDPLYVVDGKVVSDLTEIEPSDIDNIVVLKGESATAKYGSKADDGAIEITTKGNQKDKSKTKDKVKEKAKDKSQAYRVIIDPGHGGIDPGTKSQDGIEEKQLALEVSKMVGELLSGRENIEITYTRENDKTIDLTERVEASKDADLLISIHVNRDEDMQKRYSSVYLDPEGAYFQESLSISQVVGKKLNEIEREGRIAIANLFLMRSTHCPAVMVEIGYMSNESDVQYMMSENGKMEIARSLASAIESSASMSW